MKKQPISVIIPNYSGYTLLQKHLPDVFTSLQSGDEVIIVDDASPDKSVAWLKKKFVLKMVSLDEYRGQWQLGKKKGDLRLLINGSNLRFAATSNKGVSAARNDLIFLINTDVSPVGECRNTLVSWFDDLSIFAVGCLEYEEYIGGTESGKNVLWFEKGLFFHAKANNMNTGPTAWVSGGSGMFRKKIWKKLHGFDIQFAPAYWEDIDLSVRAGDLGYSVIFDRSAVVLHQHESTNAHTFGSKTLLKMSWKSADLFTRKHASVSQMVSYYFWRPLWWWQRFKVIRLSS